MVTRFGHLNLLIVILCFSDFIHDDIRCWNAPLINETFLPFEVQQILQLPIFSPNYKMSLCGMFHGLLFFP